jgi:hypothetical protein
VDVEMLTIKPNLDEAIITDSDYICLYTEGIDTCVGLALTGKTWACLAHLSWPPSIDNPFKVHPQFVDWVNSVINRYQELAVNWKLTLITNDHNSYDRAQSDIHRKLLQPRIFASSVRVIKDDSMWKVEKHVSNIQEKYAGDFKDKLISRLWECHSFESYKNS